MSASSLPSRCAAWAAVFSLFPGQIGVLQKRLVLTRQGLSNFRNLRHRKPPHALLQCLANVLAGGTADGSAAPSQQHLTALWIAAKEEVLAPKPADVRWATVSASNGETRTGWFRFAGDAEPVFLGCANQPVAPAGGAS